MDYIIQNIQLIDGRKVDILIENEQVKSILSAGEGKSSSYINGEGLFISPGWIDLHVHAMSELSPYGDEIDDIGYKQGVTTIVDAGSCGADRIGALYQKSQAAKTNVLSFLNISHIGLERIDELSENSWLDEKKLSDALNRYSSFIVGLKARISKSVVKDQGIAPLVTAKAWSIKYKLPVMVHIGSGPPDIRDVLSKLTSGDIVTHFLNGKANNLFNQNGKPLNELTEAIARGVFMDVGHGTASFSFTVAEQAKAAGIHPHTISTDIYRNNRLNGPVFSLADTLTKFIYLGYTLEEVVKMVTVHAAERIGQPQLGTISVNGKANLTLFRVKNEKKQLVDSEGQYRTANQHIEVKGVVVNGTYYAC